MNKTDTVQTNTNKVFLHIPFMKGNKHNLEHIMIVRLTPWHISGKVIKTPKTIEELRLALHNSFEI